MNLLHSPCFYPCIVPSADKFRRTDEVVRPAQPRKIRACQSSPCVHIQYLRKRCSRATVCSRAVSGPRGACRFKHEGKIHVHRQLPGLLCQNYNVLDKGSSRLLRASSELISQSQPCIRKGIFWQPALCSSWKQFSNDAAQLLITIVHPELFCSLHLPLARWVIAALYSCVAALVVQTLTPRFVEQRLYIFLFICQRSRVVKLCFYVW